MGVLAGDEPAQRLGDDVGGEQEEVAASTFCARVSASWSEWMRVPVKRQMVTMLAMPSIVVRRCRGQEPQDVDVAQLARVDQGTQRYASRGL